MFVFVRNFSDGPFDFEWLFFFGATGHSQPAHPLPSAAPDV